MIMQECEQVLAMDVVYPQLPCSLHLLGTDVTTADIPIAFLLQEVEEGAVTTANIEDLCLLILWKQVLKVGPEGCPVAFTGINGDLSQGCKMRGHIMLE